MALISRRTLVILLQASLVNVLALSVPKCCCNEEGSRQISLNKNWFVWNPKNPAINFTADVPFTVHSRLLAEGILQDPLYRFNDLKSRWVATDSWIFTSKFTVPAELFRHAVSVVFHSIDTIATIVVNGKQIGKAKNKFLKYEFDITDVIAVNSMNTIEVRVDSPIAYAKNQSELYKENYGYPVLPNCYPSVLHGECHSNFIRKEPCSFGWDFGPSLPTQGLLGEVSLQFTTAFSLEESVVNAIHSGGRVEKGWRVEVCSEARSLLRNANGIIAFSILEINDAKTEVRREFIENAILVCAVLHVDSKVELWWPRQYGKQSLYTLKITISDSFGQPIQSKEIPFGFRTVELIQQPIPGSDGLSFYFKINGVEIFLKGSNWIPADALRDRVTNPRIDEYLRAAVDANMNVLRVWGGGGFESDYFYAACDRLGLLIWHDLMFACAMYPVNPAFLDLVRNETAYQLKRLTRHPSIIVWSANNENEAALRENWYGTDHAFSRYKIDYVTLYVRNVGEVVKAIDKTRPFIVSSPSNGVNSEKQGWIAEDPRSPLYGDVHYYNYVANCWDTDLLPKPRFASEYGYQSYPSIESLKDVSLPSDLAWNSTVMQYRQHHQDGNQQIEALIKQNFRLPKSQDEFLFFQQMVFLSQVVQSLCVTFETEHYRRLRGRLVKDVIRPASSHGRTSAEGHRDRAKTNQAIIMDHGDRAKTNQAIIMDHGDRAKTNQAINSNQDYLIDANQGGESSMNHDFSSRNRYDSNPSSTRHDGGKSSPENSNPNFDDGVTLVNSTLFGATMGAMYWQLNDIWQAPSWGSIEYGGRWKMLHYSAVNFFRDVAVSYNRKGDNMDVFVVSDLLNPVSGHLNVSAFEWTSLNPIHEKTYAVEIRPQVARLITTLHIHNWCNPAEHCFLVLSLEVKGLPGYSYSRPAFLAPFSIVNTLRDPMIATPKSEMFQVSSNVIRFTVRVTFPAAFLWMYTTIPGRFSDNGFLQFESSRVVHFFGLGDVTVKDFAPSLRYMSLYDTIV